jgi:hypothetical protein
MLAGAVSGSGSEGACVSHRSPAALRHALACPVRVPTYGLIGGCHRPRLRNITEILAPPEAEEWEANMDKRATIVLQLNRATDAFWLDMVNRFDKKKVREEPDGGLYALLPVKSYSLEDQQFIPIKINVGGKVQLVCIPRSIVKTIVEGKTDLGGAFSFAISKAK